MKKADHGSVLRAVLFGLAGVTLLFGILYASGAFKNAACDEISCERGQVLSWQTASLPANGGKVLEFRYPEAFGTDYIHPLDWPPHIAIEAGPFSCTEAGDPADRAGRTEERRIQGDVYCVTEITEGAAGSIYTQYAYAREKNGSVAIMTFSTRAASCGNYDALEMDACNAERAMFAIDLLVARMMESLVLRVPPDTTLIKGGDTVLEGTTACLPHKDTTGPQTLECAFGILADDGFYYALGMYNLDPETVIRAQTSTRIRAEGFVIAAESLSTDIWHIYDIAGVMDVRSIESL